MDTIILLRELKLAVQRVDSDQFREHRLVKRDKSRNLFVDGERGADIFCVGVRARTLAVAKRRSASRPSLNVADEHQLVRDEHQLADEHQLVRVAQHQLECRGGQLIFKIVASISIHALRVKL